MSPVRSVTYVSGRSSHRLPFHPPINHLLQFLRSVGCSAIDVDAGAELACERRIFEAPPDRRHLVTTLACELNAEMPEASDPLHGNEIPRRSAAVPERVEGRYAGAEKRRRFGGVEAVRNRHQRLHRNHHILVVSAVIADARYFQIPAIAKISAPACEACAVAAAMPADAAATVATMMTSSLSGSFASLLVRCALLPPG